MDKNKYGQYMTPDIISNFMVSLITHNKNAKVLEPCCGDGSFLRALNKKDFNNIEAFEIDKDIIDTSYNYVKNQSYIDTEDNEEYDVIIGNPPYIRWKNLEEELKKELYKNELWNKYSNALCDYSIIFMVKAIKQLKENGELIFITPEYWLKTTHSAKLRKLMLDNGYIDRIFHFNETPIFKDANVSLIIFKYIKSKDNKNKKIDVAMYNSKKKLTDDILNCLLNKKEIKNANYFKISQFENEEDWVLANDETKESIYFYEKSCNSTFADKCRIGNGMVSGLDKAFQIKDYSVLNKEEQEKTIEVLKAKNLCSYYHNETIRYIFVNNCVDEKEFLEKYPNFYKQLIGYKEKLENRYNYGKDIKFWDWVFLRNYENMFKKEYEKIFVPCKERITKKETFRFSLSEANIFPTQDVTSIYLNEDTKESIYYVLAMLNSKEVFNWLSNKGVRKGDIVEFCERPISIIPYREIDFTNKTEVTIYEKICDLVKTYLRNKNDETKEEIQQLFSVLVKES